MPATTVQVLDVYDDVVKHVAGLCHRYHVRSPDSDDLVQEALTAIVASGGMQHR